MKKVHRTWGWWSVLAEYDKSCKIKELVVDPQAKLSKGNDTNLASEAWLMK